MDAHHDQLTILFSRDPKNLCNRITFFQPTFDPHLRIRDFHPVQLLSQFFPETSFLRGQRRRHDVQHG
jgi:hypothetical protein